MARSHPEARALLGLDQASRAAPEARIVGITFPASACIPTSGTP